jgi:ribonucleoside-diphosphate reductase alpha chain
MKIIRRFTTPGRDVFETVEWERRRSRISDAEGRVVFEMRDAEVPKFWSQLATDIMVSKYFRKAGVPQYHDDGTPKLDKDGRQLTGPENSVRQVINRLVGCWRHWAERHGYFDGREDAEAFSDELAHMLLHQMAAPNSPQWFNTGLHWAYGITGPAQGHWVADPRTGEAREAAEAYQHPQAHACFIQSIKDDLVGPGGIMDLWTREARLFKYGSGCTSGDSLVYIEGEGLVRLRDLFARFQAEGRRVEEFDGKGRFIDVGDRGLRTLSMDPETAAFSFNHIELVWSYNVDPDDKLSVHLDTGCKVDVSRWHPFLVWDGSNIVERRADELKRGDTVLGPNETAVESLPSIAHEITYTTPFFGREETRRVPVDDDLAWLCGYFLGDGSLGRRPRRVPSTMRRRHGYDSLRRRFHDETIEVLERVQRVIARIFGTQTCIQEDGRRGKGRHLAYTSRLVTGFFASVFGVGPKTHSLRMPAFVWEGGRNLALSFLAGLVDSDGWAATGSAKYATACSDFAERVSALACLLGLGGGIVRTGNTSVVTILHRSAPGELRSALAARITHPERRRRLLAYTPPHERKYCMPLAPDLKVELFGSETLHLGRLHYERLINPKKLDRSLALLERSAALGTKLARVARSAAFVTHVEPCTGNPDFFDLTVARHANYLAGERGMAVIHNTGTNFSSLRAESEPLSGGGKSSGLMSFLKIGDRAAGAIKSGGTTRRAAKMVCLDADHPDIEDFVNWKAREELKVAAMVEGLKHLPPDQQEFARRLDLKLDYDFNGEAYQTVSGQNSNNSVRLRDAFFEAADADGEWNLYRRTDGQIARTVKARELWEKICFAAWRCADPGVQFDTTINAWHTCPESGRIEASNPCSEYLFVDDTACNLASINLLRFYDAERRLFDVEGFEHAVRLWTMVLEVSVLMAAYPSKAIAEKSWRFRTLGLGFANLGAMLMQAGIPYDSDEARAVCGAVSAVMTGRSYAMSAEMARELGPFPGFEENREPMLRVIRNHRRAALGVARDAEEYEDLHIRPVPIDHDLFRGGRINLANAQALLVRATVAWHDAVRLGERHGFRNAQTTVIAPTGTIGLLMDCDTTGVEPDFALTKFKKLAGGGYFKIANQSLRPALRTLGYGPEEIDEIVTYVMGTLSLDTPMPEGGPGAGSAGRSLREFLVEQGYTSEDLVELENQLPTVFELPLAFTAWSMPRLVLQSLGVDVNRARDDGAFNGLRALGLSEHQIDALNQAVCGTQTVEGAPHLRPDHLPVFDCASACGRIGKRFIATEGHIRMMAAAQPFISGAISKTINLPAESGVRDIAGAYRLSWELGLKANALYRDGSKLSQPLSTRVEAESSSAADRGAKLVEAALGEASTAVAGAAPAISTSSISFASPAPPVSPVPPAEPAAPVVVERIVERVVDRPLRRRLPETRRSVTHRFNVSGHEGYLTVGLYDDGAPGELFITMAKEGSTIGGLMDCLGTAISVALQYGVPLESLVTKFAHQRFEPMGMTTNSDIPFAKSLVDYIFRWLGMEFIPGYREQNAPKRGTPAPPSAAPLAREAAPRRLAQDAPLDLPAPRGHAAPAAPAETTVVAATSVRISLASALDLSHAAMMGDAPACDVCGSITVRNGSCYKCMNCGNSMGCS